jgi:hypothetical protein
MWYTYFKADILIGGMTLKKFFTAVALAVSAAFVLTGCASTSEAYTLQINVSKDAQFYEDLNEFTEGKEALVVDNEKNIRTFFSGDWNCPPMVERILIDGDKAYVYLETYSEAMNCSELVQTMPQKVVNVGNFGNFEEIKNFYMCTTQKDCKPIEKVVYSRLV